MIVQRFFFLLLVLVLELASCSQDNKTNHMTNKVDSMALKLKGDTNKYGLEATKSVYSFIDANIDMKQLKKFCDTHTDNVQFEVGIDIKDSIISNCTVFYYRFNNVGDLLEHKKGCQLIEKVFLNKKPKFEFIDYSNSSSYDFNIKLSRLCNG